ncbi:MAG: hypothetical protein ACPGYS_02670 [Flavobacteriales bacterium]
MEPLDFPAVQAQLVRCQEVLDAARQEGWTEDLVAAFDEATRDLHEGAVVRKALQLPKVTAAPEETEESHEGEPAWDAPPAEPPVNRLLTPEERGDAPAESQVDLLSSIGELTLAEKLALQPLGSVAEGMSILDRAQYTSVLFSGEEEVFSTLLEKLSRASTQEEALAMFQEALAPRGEDKEVEGLKESFAKRIMRTFVS